MSKFLMALLLSISSLAARAQVQMPGCPPGVMPGQPGCGGGESGAPRKNVPAYTGPLWQDRYGAIAESQSTAGAGAAQNMSSKRAARKKALSDCGRSDCTIVTEVRNSCLAAAWGGGVSGYGAKMELHEAEEEAVNGCKNGGGGDCKIQYSACSLPVRIR